MTRAPSGPDHRFYVTIALATMAFLAAGFWRSFYLRPLYASVGLPPLLQLHGLVFTAWPLLVVAQTSLVGAGRVRAHQLVGLGGIGLALLMVLLGLVTTLVRGPVHPDPPVLYAVAFGDLGLFAVFFAGAVVNRDVADVHKRLMVLALVATVGTGVGRWPVVAALFERPVVWMLVTLVITQTILGRRRHRGPAHPRAHPPRLRVGWAGDADGAGWTYLAGSDVRVVGAGDSACSWRPEPDTLGPPRQPHAVVRRGSEVARQLLQHGLAVRFHLERGDVVGARHATVDDRDRRPLAHGLSAEAIARVDHQRRPDDEEHAGPGHGVRDLLDARLGDLSAEEHDVRHEQTATVVAVGDAELRERSVVHLRVPVGTGSCGTGLE